MKNMTAIIGSNGQLGYELVRQAGEAGTPHLALDMPDIDITSIGSIDDNLGSKDISIVINAAAYTAVDKAESEPELAHAVNSDGPANLATFCAERGTPLVHVSTDYVFDGNKAGAYDESDPVSPVGVYAQSKAEGERNIARITPDHVIVRTAWLYGRHGANFVKTMLRLGRERRTIQVVNDQVGCPTCAADLAGALLAVSRQIQAGHRGRGVYHYCGLGSTSWFGFAEAVFEVAGTHERFALEALVPITTAEYPTPAKRPMNSVMDCTKIQHTFGIQTRPWRRSLSETIEALYHQTVG